MIIDQLISEQWRKNRWNWNWYKMFVAIIWFHEKKKIVWPIQISVEKICHTHLIKEMIWSIQLIWLIVHLMRSNQSTEKINCSQFQRAFESYNYDIRILIDAIFFFIITVELPFLKVKDPSKLHLPHHRMKYASIRLRSIVSFHWSKN